MAMNSGPFWRARAMSAKVSDIIAAGGGDLKIKIAIEALGEYTSRGKSSRKSKPSRNYFRGNRSKYKPHQGMQETFRRFIGGWSRAELTKNAMVGNAGFYPEGSHGTAR
jgi:hypothetical protein